MSNFLVGKTITGIKIAEDKKALLFLTDQGDAVLKAEGDCCSNSWVEHVELPALGFPATVTAVSDIEMPQPEQTEEYEHLQVYGCKITTDKGEIIIDYRNESNGYYGGSLSWPDEVFYGGVYGQNLSEQKWVEIESLNAT